MMGAPEVPTLKWRDRTERETLRVEFEVITPVFGGGVRIDSKAPQQKPIDPVTPIRSASIRGQLRFWWRAMRGAGMASVAEMRQAESKIWGGATKPGEKREHDAVSLRVEQDKIATTRDTGSHGPDLKYGTFPLDNSPPGHLSVVSGTATLILDFPTGYASDVCDAVAAWLTFGGIGGRTRRGFGAVASVGLIDHRLVEGLERLETERAATTKETLNHVPSLASARTFKMARATTARECLTLGLGLLRSFRQDDAGRKPKKDTKTGRPGRSYWPEADFIRSKWRGGKYHDRIVHVDAAPRAAFGMPIIFHFPGERVGDIQLLPAGQNRMASPLIIRPIRAPGGFVCIGLVLNVHGREAIPLIMQRNRDELSVRAELTLTEAAKIKPLDGQLDPLRAFENYCTRKS